VKRYRTAVAAIAELQRLPNDDAGRGTSPEEEASYSARYFFNSNGVTLLRYSSHSARLLRRK
jgi:hypothetical protein